AAKAHSLPRPLLQFAQTLFERREVAIDTAFNCLAKSLAELATVGFGLGFGTKIEIRHRRSSQTTRVAVRRMSRPSIFRLRIVIRARISRTSSTETARRKSARSRARPPRNRATSSSRFWTRRATAIRIPDRLPDEPVAKWQQFSQRHMLRRRASGFADRLV